MNETQKPFACCEKDCEMTFTNEDHLNWHQKKHDMILNLGVTKNDVADQTPTPTRFIRNCEEVGLFQDLQNVNPFDEFFKKAVELAKNGGTLEVPETNSDDTLHTPHILPHVEENRKKNNVNSSQDDNNSRSNEFSLNTVIPIEDVCTNESNEEECDTPVIVIDDESDNEKDIKKRIKEALQNKEKQRMEKENYTNAGSNNTISVIPFQNLTVAEKEKAKTITDKNKSPTVDDNREKIREMNRAAQIRCRKRKQIRWKEMEEEILILKDENKRLRMENYNLQCQLIQIKKTSDNGTVSPAATTLPVLPQILPKLNNTTNPIVIQILPGASNAVPVNENSISNIKIENVCSISSSNSDSVQKTKKNLRKIIPKIIIEN
ncbi:uncharacterized protein LOC108907836 [Anoplophora glabripennis]|nr:uncharacterized protein LOC108907836 [Anoplophora glabripennis]